MVNGLVDIVIVNWNSGEYLKNCVESVLKSNYKNYSIKIVDNGSTDNSCSDLPVLENIHIYYLGNNFGFGKACNKALEISKGEYILLLNPDTETRPETIEKAISFLSANKQCTVYGCAQVSENGELQKNTVGRFPTVISFCNEVLGLSVISPKLFKNGFIRTDLDYSNSSYVEHVMGSFYLIRRSWIEKNGFMDDRYFVYLEDIDLSLRVIKTGGKIYYDSTNFIFHKQGGVSEKVKAERLFYSLHAKHEFIRKHFNFPFFIFADLVMLVPGFFTRLLHTLIFQRELKGIKEGIKGYYLLYKHLLFKNAKNR